MTGQTDTPFLVTKRYEKNARANERLRFDPNLPVELGPGLAVGLAITKKELKITDCYHGKLWDNFCREEFYILSGAFRSEF